MEISYFLSNFFNLILIFAMLSVFVTCRTGMSLCSSRYQRAASFLQHALVLR